MTTENNPIDSLNDARADLRRHSLELLEFSRIREFLASYTQLPTSHELALALEPTYDPIAVARQQQETSEADLLLKFAGDSNLSLDRDIRPAIQRLWRDGQLTGEELLATADTLEITQQTKAYAMRLRTRTPALKALAKNIPDLRWLVNEIRRQVLPTGGLADDATPHLRELRRGSRKAYQNTISTLELLMQTGLIQEALQEHLITVRNERLVLPVKAEFRKRIPGIVHSVSDSGSTVFIEPFKTVRQCNAWREWTATEYEETLRILRQLSATIRKQLALVRYALELSGRVDLIIAKARYSQAINGISAYTLNTGLRLLNGRHPLLKGTPVPISINLDMPPKGIVVTGPNMGGKTAALKTIGLLILMNQAGLRIPAMSDTALPVVDGVYADIGDQQSIEQSISTFSSHVATISKILETATSKSFVLLDELGTSTDPEEGAALAKAILAYLMDKDIPTVVTTHHRSLAVFAEDHPALENASVELDHKTLTATYAITLGLPGRSYAMEVAERLGLRQEILQAARRLRDPAQETMEVLLADLQKERYKTRARLMEAERTEARARDLEHELESRLTEFNETKLQLAAEARLLLMERTKKLRSLLKQTEARLGWESSTRSTDRRQSTKIDEARQDVTEIERQLRPRTWAGNVDLGSQGAKLHIGDTVRVGSFGFTGTVTSLPGGDGTVEIVAGNARVRLPVTQLRKIEQSREPPPRPEQEKPDQLPAAHSIIHVVEIDLRGLRLHESLERLDRFLDETLIHGHDHLRIIHGKGTGALRRGVWRHLASHQSVQHFDYCDSEHGGEGATSVGLK